MFILDENISNIERLKLLKLNIKVKQIGVDINVKGIQDEDIIPFLHSLKDPTFFSWDSDFYNNKFIHKDYCLVYLDTNKKVIAKFINKFLNLHIFDTKEKRKGKIIKMTPTRIKWHEINYEKELIYLW